MFSFQYSPCLKSLFLLILYKKGNVLLQEPSTVALADVFGSQQQSWCSAEREMEAPA